MAADDFTLTPTVVIPEVPDYHTIITQSESMKKHYASISLNAVQRFKLMFKGITYSVFTTVIAAHYAARKGQYDNFSWTSVPAYIDTDLDGIADGTSMTGRWVEDSMSVTPLGRSYCNAEIIFEKDV